MNITRTDDHDLQAHLEDEGLLTWDKLLDTPSCVERNLADPETRLLLIAASYGGNHTLARPFCGNPACGCHKNDDLFDAYILEPMLAGLMTSYEANRLMWNETL